MSAWGRRLVAVLLAALVGSWFGGMELGKAALRDTPAALVEAPTSASSSPTPAPSVAPVVVPARCEADAVTLDLAREQSRYAELRYSPGCALAWVRGQGHATRVRAYRAGRVVAERPGPTGWGISPPVDARGRTVEACLAPAYGVAWVCTRRVAQ